MARTARRRPAVVAPAELAKRALCAAVFAEPACVERVLAHDVNQPLTVEPHAHRDMLQLDLLDGCVGTVTQDGVGHPVSGVTVTVARPGVTHGYTLRPEHRRARVCLLRLRTGAAVSALPPLRTGLPPLEHLAGLLAQAAANWTPSGIPLTAAARVAEAVCLWPAADESAGIAEAARGDAPAAGDAVSDRVRRAAVRLARRHDNPPSLDELAKAASVSPRHFARRFAAEFNCTPHEYVTARRLDAARALLLSPDTPIAHAAEELGFTSASAFSRWFSRAAGRSPRAFQKDPGVF